jgi:anti-sigma B factor antagonist
MPPEQPSVRVTVEHVPGTDIVTAIGTVDLDTVSHLRDVVFDPTRCVQAVMLLDLNGVDFLDSQGIASIVAARRKVGSRGGELVLACSQPHLLKLLRISRLDTVLRVVGSVEEQLREAEDGIA